MRFGKNGTREKEPMADQQGRQITKYANDKTKKAYQWRIEENDDIIGGRCNNDNAVITT